MDEAMGLVHESQNCHGKGALSAGAFAIFAMYEIQYIQSGVLCLLSLLTCVACYMGIP
jgi:hypothetical protein